MAKDNAAPEYDTDNMDEAAVNAAIDGMKNGDDVTQPEPEKEPDQVVDVPETQEAEIDEPVKADEGDGEDGKGKGKSDFVPHKTFHFANEKRKAAEAELKTERESRARLEERLKVILEAQTPAQQQVKEPEIPDPKTDPIGYMEWDRAQRMEAAAKAKETEAQTEQQRQEQAYVESVFNDSVAEFQATAAAEPDLPTMYEGVWNSYIEELRAAGVAEQNLVAEAQALEKQHMLYAKQRGIPIVQYLKGIAKARNIQAKAPEPAAPANDQPRDAEGKFQAAQKREAAKAAATSLGQTGGAVANMGGLTMENVLNMSDDEFREYMDKNGGSLRKLYGQ